MNEKRVTPKLRKNGDEATKSKILYLDNRDNNHMIGEEEKLYEIDKTIKG